MPGAVSDVATQTRAELIDMALTGGVTPFTHPLHIGSVKPLLLVEGRDDREILLRAYADSGEACPYDIKAMVDLEPTMSGGVEQIEADRANNRSALRARPSGSPVIALLDWEVPENKRAKIERLLSEHPASICRLMPKASRTPKLKDTIPGIESYLSLDFYRAAESELGLRAHESEQPGHRGLGARRGKE